MEKTTIQDHQCPICYSIFVEPVQLPCKHCFCFACLDNMQDMQTIHWKCPMCRVTISPTFQLEINLEKASEAKKSYPEEFEARKKQLVAEKKLQENKTKVKFIFGNTHELVESDDSNVHRWKVYFKCENPHINMTKFIKEVKFELHPTFHPKIVIINQPPYELTRLGWGYFDIPITVTWTESTNMPQTKINHCLNFSRQITSNTIKVSIDNNYLEEVHNNQLFLKHQNFSVNNFKIISQIQQYQDIKSDQIQLLFRETVWQYSSVECFVLNQTNCHMTSMNMIQQIFFSTLLRKLFLSILLV